jgi:hypothetical protein
MKAFIQDGGSSLAVGWYLVVRPRPERPRPDLLLGNIGQKGKEEREQYGQDQLWRDRESDGARGSREG